MRVDSSDLTEVLPVRVFCDCIPGLKWCPGVVVVGPEFAQPLPGYDSHLVAPFTLGQSKYLRKMRRCQVVLSQLSCPCVVSYLNEWGCAICRQDCGSCTLQFCKVKCLRHFQRQLSASQDGMRRPSPWPYDASLLLNLRRVAPIGLKVQGPKRQRRDDHE